MNSIIIFYFLIVSLLIHILHERFLLLFVSMAITMNRTSMCAYILRTTKLNLAVLMYLLFLWHSVGRTPWLILGLHLRFWIRMMPSRTDMSPGVLTYNGTRLRPRRRLRLVTGVLPIRLVRERDAGLRNRVRWNRVKVLIID